MSDTTPGTPKPDAGGEKLQRTTLSRIPRPPKVDKPIGPVRQAPLPRREPPPSVNPKRVRGGVKLRSKEGVSTAWIAQRWVRLLEEGCEGEPNVEGLDYAKMGQTKSLTVGTGLIEAVVQGRSMKPYTVRITCETYGHEAWDKVVAATIAEPIYSAKMLAGEVPEHIEDLFHPLGLNLFPKSAADLTLSCTCGHGTPWCKHVACVMYLVADAMASDPFIMFNLRGIATESLVERLRQRRTSEGSVHGAPPVYAAHVPGASDGEAESLDSSLESFWEAGDGLAELDLSIDRPVVNKALLRRLGPSPFASGRFPLVGLLATCYDVISDAAVRGSDEPEDQTPAEQAAEPKAKEATPDAPAEPVLPPHVRRAMRVKGKAAKAAKPKDS